MQNRSRSQRHSPASFRDLFSDHAERYTVVGPRHPDTLFQFIASLAPGTLHARDFATGSGQASVSLASHFECVSSSDSSPEQIAHAIPCENVTCSIQPAESTNYANSSFDAVCVAQALHWFDQTLFFAEVKRVLKPDRVFAARGCDWFNVSPAFDAAFANVALRVIEHDWAPQNAILWNGCRDIEMPFESIETPQLSIRITWNLYNFSPMYTPGRRPVVISREQEVT
jgi:SAM-dependent methyltransferase